MASYATAERLPVDERRIHFTGKRRAEDDLESQSSISSHFKKLRLNHAVPQSLASPQISPTTVSFRPQSADVDARPTLATHPPLQHDSSAPFRMPTIADTDFMTVDDTPHRVIISDLDAEIAQIEADEAAATSAVFLPDIDKKVSSIPSRVLHHRAPTTPPQNFNTALVLYREPSSIGVPEERDVVRKAIVAARARAREKQAEELREQKEKQQAILDADFSGHEIDLDDAIAHQTAAEDEDLDADAMEIE
ncbi:hypothetical protein A1O3_09474 [Capronia epimyces CBS 606.96]|uniref:Uncharacterized protein n=1 Tax=Capronia epimyces CBS 606.96 TaxID=1182542 RepID=W9XDL7_9EURO|nr:uncharacterized protein A1O3_09474 [Capronia epimyces CBS 606.96]EXJ78313.1 hypothetical protein A1O3_09474 [Capronia epimyces CBS 606.96]